jgi:hypothetical protein
MIGIRKTEDHLILEYKSDQGDTEWVDRKLVENGYVTIRKVFTFTDVNLVENDEEDGYGRIRNPFRFTDENLGENDEEDYLFESTRIFILGKTVDGFYKINKGVLGLKNDLFLAKDMEINEDTFIAYRDISIFRKIDQLVDEPIVIGGNSDHSIPVDDFQTLLKTFPNSTELTHYSRAKITRILKDYLETMSDAQQQFETYLTRKKTVKTHSKTDFLKEYEIKKYEFIRDELKNMLDDSESYDEKQWQNHIVRFILLLFPKYVAVLENLNIKDFYTNPQKISNRYIDLALVDANGTIDIIEIKKPFSNHLLSKRKYRDNHTPHGELSGAVMQVEKYMFHLSKWGRAGERKILKKHGDTLPPDFEIRISNPKAMIILGRDNDFQNDQKFDFEIIKRKYANIIDILTYDDLLKRLDNILLMLSKNNAVLSTGSNVLPSTV